MPELLPTSTVDPTGTARWLRGVAFIGATVFVAIVALLHVVRPDVSPLERGISRYAGAPTLWLATTAFVMLTAALVALAAVVRMAGRSAVSIVLAAAGLAIVTLTPIGSPPVVQAVVVLHNAGGLLFYGGIARAMWVSDDAMFGRRCAAWFLGLLALFLAGGAGVPGVFPVRGVLQRAVFALAAVWIVRTAIQSGHAGQNR